MSTLRSVLKGPGKGFLSHFMDGKLRLGIAETCRTTARTRSVPHTRPFPWSSDSGRRQPLAGTALPTEEWKAGISAPSVKGVRGKKRSDTDRPESDKVKSDLVSSWAYMSLWPLTACQSDLFLGIIGGSGGVEEIGDITGTGGLRGQ